jgi:predicted AAA+ superfamily ATPase
MTIKKEIFNTIRGNTGPALSIRELSKRTGYARPTVSKYVLVLEAEKKINVDRENRVPYVLVERV